MLLGAVEIVLVGVVEVAGEVVLVMMTRLRRTTGGLRRILSRIMVQQEVPLGDGDLDSGLAL